ncbi:gamma-glutamyltranspeptidase / glutathione hydrolase [Parapedobacter composti]|uniref:Glutathione hydrolase proenzyme n=1 Tax=Parapedobacter composti TaxID=623281 RepID=A0A1I1E883_9SPHI|nr:gamma-glutamyltransferase [Parapedobacter composti]SFB83321.1 gamma-glutamyltranspeptidase / glutathione hydrolase [Parapedobacter composti]
MNKLASLLSIFFLAFGCGQNNRIQIDAYDYDITKKVTVPHAAVVSAHPLASEVGLAILRKGGNAVDAAIATQFALAVVYPNAGNLGGGGFLVLHRQNGENITFDFRERAPGNASRDMYLDEQGEAVSTLSRDGHLAAGVPGTVAGAFASHDAYGRLPMAELIQPAIELAAKGFAITEREARGLNRTKGDFEKYNTKRPAFVKDGDWKEGDTLIQTDLARTLERIRDLGQAGFYEGETADLIVAEMTRGGGIISHQDLKDYRAVQRDPITFDYRDYRIVTMPLPSSGGVMMQQMLGMLEAHPIGQYGYGTSEAVQLMIEIERRAYADRTEYMGDPDFVEVPVHRLVDKQYLAERMSDYSPLKATPSVAVQAGVWQESEETTHLSVVDEEGNAVAVTTTLNGAYGSRVVVGGAGFILNNEMDDFSAKPGVPNKFGLLGTDANAIAPGKRMLSSMTPTIVLKDNAPYLVLGTPGGSTIITSVFQTLVNILDFGLSVEEAVNNPKFHHQWQPDVVYVERDFSAETRAKLMTMGYQFTERAPIGRTEVIRITESGVEAVADKRGDDSAAGY